MNDALWSWFAALSAPLKPHDVPVNGSAEPTTSYRLPVAGFKPALSLYVPAPNQYSRTSLRPSPEPPSGRQRASRTASGNVEHCAFSNGSYRWPAPAVYSKPAYLPVYSTRP